MTSGELIRQSRIKHKVTQKELGKQLGLKGGQAISNLERGIATLSLKHIETVSKFLSIDKERLLSAVVKDRTLRLVSNYDSSKEIVP